MEADMVAAAAAGVVGIGYANRPGKTERLAAAGAAAVTSSMLSIAGALNT
jgi:phosphoglycolate phosphatase-like HAD superfamily hydrolase